MKTPDLSKRRRVVFGDMDFDKIDWIVKKNACINRVFERGNEEEKKEITRFYGKEESNQFKKRSVKSNHAFAIIFNFFVLVFNRQ